MPDNNIINSNFKQIAVTDASDNVTGITLSGATALKVAGGTSGQALVSDGSGGFTWATPGGVTSTYGQITQTGTITVASSSVNAATGTQICTFTLPAIGTYEIVYTARVQSNNGSVMAIALWDATAGSIVTNSELGATGANGATNGFFQVQLTGRVFITTTATNTVIAMRGYNNGFSYIAFSDAYGRNRMTYMRIA